MSAESRTTRARAMRRRGRRRARAVALGASVLVLILGLATAGERLWYRGEVLPGVDIAGASLTGDDGTAAARELERLAERLEANPVRARAGETELSFDPAEIGYEVDAGATAAATGDAGRTGNPAAQVVGTFLRRVRDDEVTLVARWHEADLGTVLDRWDEELGAGLQNGGLRFEGAEVVEIEPRSGAGLERRDTERRLAAALSAGETELVELPINEADPAVGEAEVERAAAEAREILSAPYTLMVDTTPITIAPEVVGAAMSATPQDRELVLGVDANLLRMGLAPALAAFESAPADARWQVFGSAVALVPAMNGRAVDLTAVAEAILRQERTIVAHLIETPAALTTEAAQALNITEKVSEFTTSYAAGQARVQNIHRAADITNQTIVKPGETFSLNARLGPRDCAAGWVRAPAFSTQDGFFEECGGGVSQFSTTLFNATFFGGYDDLEHTPHSIYISRYPMGREATLGFGSIDNRFRNDSSSGILIVATHTPTSVTVVYYGNREGRTVTAEGPHVLEQIPPTVEYVDNPFLPAGQEVPVPNEAGYTGFKVENFRVLHRPGQAPQRERLYWEYDMRPRKIWRGTAS